MKPNGLDSDAPATTIRVTPWIVLGITSLGVFAVLLDALVLVIAFPALLRSFSHASSAELSWVLNAYTIVYGALLVPAGRFADLVGRKRMFLFGVALFTLASVACGFAGSPGWLIGLRIVQAIGGAMLTPSSLALTLAAFPQEKRPIAVTLWAAVGALAVLIGPLVGSWVVQAAGWPGIFFLNLPIGLATVLLGRSRLTDSRDESMGGVPDVLGIALLIGGATLVAYGVVTSEVSGWADPHVFGTVGAGLVILLAFLRQSARSAAPVLDLGLFDNRNFALGNLGLFVFSIAFSGLFLSAVFFLTRVWGYSLVQTGLAMTPGPLMVVVFAPIAGRIAAARGHRGLLVPGGLLYAAGFSWLTLLATQDAQYLTLYLPATVLTGLGVAFVLPVLSSAAVHELPPAELALGSGVTTAIRQFGTVLGVAIAIALLGRAPDTVRVFVRIWVLMITSGTLVSVIGLGIDTRPGRPRGDRAPGRGRIAGYRGVDV